MVAEYYRIRDCIINRFCIVALAPTNSLLYDQVNNLSIRSSAHKKIVYKIKKSKIHKIGVGEATHKTGHL